MGKIIKICANLLLKQALTCDSGNKFLNIILDKIITKKLF